MTKCFQVCCRKLRQYREDSPFYRLLATKYESEREQEALEILNKAPEPARLAWLDSDHNGEPFVKGSTALHYAANGGKLTLAQTLIDYGADVNASYARWFRSVL